MQKRRRPSGRRHRSTESTKKQPTARSMGGRNCADGGELRTIAIHRASQCGSTTKDNPTIAMPTIAPITTDRSLVWNATIGRAKFGFAASKPSPGAQNAAAVNIGGQTWTESASRTAGALRNMRSGQRAVRVTAKARNPHDAPTPTDAARRIGSHAIGSVTTAAGNGYRSHGPNGGRACATKEYASTPFHTARAASHG